MVLHEFLLAGVLLAQRTVMPSIQTLHNAAATKCMAALRHEAVCDFLEADGAEEAFIESSDLGGGGGGGETRDRSGHNKVSYCLGFRRSFA